MSKQADFALWSGHPLQIATRCEQTFIAGRRYYDRARDKQTYSVSLLERKALLDAARRSDPFDWQPTFFKKKKEDPHSDSCHGGAQ